MSRPRLLAFVAVLWLAAASALAVEPGEMLADPALEARAREISRGVRCMVCQNESIDASAADLAHDLRVIVRERLTAGDSDDQVRQFLVARYGDYILLKPPVRPSTYLLWFGPAAILVIAGAAILLRLRRRTGALPTPAPLSAEEQRRLSKLVGDDGAAKG